MKYPAYPTRLVDLPPEQDPRQVGLLVRSAVADRDEDPEPVILRAQYIRHRSVEQRSRVLRFALVGAGLFVAGGVVGAAVQPLLRSPAAKSSGGGPEVRPPSKRGTSPRGHAARPRDETPVNAPLTLGPAVADDGLSPVPRLPAPQSAGHPGSVVAWAPTASGTPRSPIPDHWPRLPAQNRASRGETPAGVNAPRMRASSPRPIERAAEPRAAIAPSVPASLLPAASAAFAPAPILPAPAPTVSAAPPVATSPAEQSLIAAAFDKLRTAREPRTALALLDEYRRRFPTGEFLPEATRLRTEALLLLGRRDAALDELEGNAPTTPATDERRVLRGELRAAAGRWQAAHADFDDVVRAHSGQLDSRKVDLIERALWGRASARSHLGDDTAARADLREYLRRFPDGRFAKQARRLLGEGS